MDGEALSSLWAGEVCWGLDIIAPGGAWRAPWFNEGRRDEAVWRQVERHWRISKSEEDQIHARAHYRSHTVAMMVAKKGLFSSTIPAVRTRQADLF